MGTRKNQAVVLVVDSSAGILVVENSAGVGIRACLVVVDMARILAVGMLGMVDILAVEGIVAMETLGHSLVVPLFSRIFQTASFDPQFNPAGIATASLFSDKAHRKLNSRQDTTEWRRPSTEVQRARFRDLPSCSTFQ